MRKYPVNGAVYRLASKLTPFQLDMQVHLTNWKWRNLKTRDCGLYKGQPYDVILPTRLKDELQPIYRPIVERVEVHRAKVGFKLHKFVGHMASSQVACINLFVPLLEQPEAAAQVLRLVKPDLETLATDKLDGGFQIEFWPGAGDEPGPLNDHTKAAGTDADIAIAYRDGAGHLKLWLIEHKLTEAEFTTCGGAVSAGRTDKHRCAPTSDILKDHNLCYYHESKRCHYAYWAITDRHPNVFPPERLAAHKSCPFGGGMNQLWRNMLLALAVEDASECPYDEIHFSVVHHPGNDALQPSMNAFKGLLGDDARFSWFTSDQVVTAAAEHSVLSEWAKWYRNLYWLDYPALESSR
ncbi:MAG: hypothetical protein K8T26_11395 [Lentisphaerae bacterium]|nr:hypothetical protein [Lentisphaerota bacterium]